MLLSVKRLFLLLVLMAMPFLGVQSVHAFSMSISPASKTFELNRGETVEYTLNFTNNSSRAVFDVDAQNFAYTSYGAKKVIFDEDIADPSQALSSWITLPKDILVGEKSQVKIPVSITVPDDAPFGDQFVKLAISQQTEKAKEGSGSTVGVGGAIVSVLSLKVLGGQTVKEGVIQDFYVETQERARNTANVFVKFLNTGNQFYDAIFEVNVYDGSEDENPVKTLGRNVLVVPNVVNTVKFPVGDLGDDYGEKDYLVTVAVYEAEAGTKKKLVQSTKTDFFYYVPVGSGAEDLGTVLVEKQAVVGTDIVAVIKELWLYGFLTLVVLLVLIRVLFFTPRSEKKD